MITTEVRFFFEELNDGDFSAFQRKLNLASEGERTDHYIKFRQSATCGVKMREGKLEVKSLIHQVSNEPTLTSWEKLSLEKGETEIIGEKIAVLKRRWVNYFNENAEKVEPDENPHCQFELSMVMVGEKVFQSICLEASGNTEAIRVKILKGVWKVVLDKLPKLGALLAEVQPQSYPEFLLWVSRRGHFR